MEVEQIIALMKAVSETGLTDFSYEENGIKLQLKKHPEKKIVAPTTSDEYVRPHAIQTAQTDMDREETASESCLPAGSVVKSPLVGTYYAAGAPGAEPYVKVGDTVHRGQVLGIVEAMKLMNEIESEYDGVIKAVLVNNGDLIEYDQPMFVIG